MAQEIIIEFDVNGNPVIEALGFKGKMCEKYLNEISKILGKVTDVKEKPEKLKNHTSESQKA